MGLELAGVTRIDHPHEARAKARAWSKMARELDTPDAPDAAKEKVRELRARASAANTWARKQEDALLAGEKVIRHLNAVESRGSSSARDAGAAIHRQPGHARRAARAAGHAAYTRARPAAMRIVHDGRAHFFQGVSEPFGAAGGGFDLVMEGLGLTLAVILIADLLKAPKAIATTSSHALGFVARAVDTVDPLTGKHAKTA